MLALAHGEGQSIIIDGKIEVKIVKWSRSSVRIAIQAPREITVDRDEIWRKMHPGELTPLEKAENERRERFAREGGAPGGPAGPGAEIQLFAVRAPQAGKIILRANPDAPPFVAVGAKVDETTLLAHVESSEIPPTTTTTTLADLHAEVPGTIARILVSRAIRLGWPNPVPHPPRLS